MTDPILGMQMATMRCLACGRSWEDLDAATNQYPTPCSCGSFRTEPAYDVDGALMPHGWMWAPPPASTAEREGT
jgi:hypothetical protein